MKYLPSFFIKLNLNSFFMNMLSRRGKCMFLCSLKSHISESQQRATKQRKSHCVCTVVACMLTIMLHYGDVPFVMYDCDFQGAHCMKYNQWLISPCTRGTTAGRLLVCFSSPSLFTGNFHVVNGGIDSHSLLFVLSSVHLLRREQERKLAQVLLHSMGGNVINGSNLTRCLLRDVCYDFCDLIWIPLICSF